VAVALEVREEDTELEELVTTTLDVPTWLLDEEMTLLLLDTWDVSLYSSSLLPAPQYSSKY